MKVKKWRYIGGYLYRLSEVFTEGRDAVSHARLMKETRFTIIVRLSENKWAVYWRARIPEYDANEVYIISQ